MTSAVVSALGQLALALAYPATILAAWFWDAPRLSGALLLVLLWLQRWLGRGVIARSLRQLTALDGCVALALSACSITLMLSGSELLLRLYPAFINLGLLVAFGATLFRGPPMIEKFARLGRPQLDARGMRHTLWVTRVWCVFFALNAVFSAYTALHWSRAAWSLYNGAIVYGLIGLLMLGEIVWRYLVVLPRAVRVESL
ncbi:hypothetical protein [Paraburkholderia bonniea]|uniref:COG4648 family protein n=1 Tax=Paraburkholderia bonniea TaxID=2152891 RepID=UPI001291A9EC|nr:hypothetical protein [Paraburkholderia bonniea]